MLAKSQAAAVQPNPLSFFIFIVLGAISALTPLAIDMYVPAMPAIAKDLMADTGAVQLSLTAYGAGFAIGQLFHGPISDSYGRRPVLIIGVLCFALTAMLTATVHSIDTLNFLRVIQGLSGAASAVVIQAVIRDMFNREDFAKAMSFITLVMTLAPLVAPMLGGHLAMWFGWRSIYWVLAVYAVVALIMVYYKIPETLQVHQRQTLNMRTTLKNYIKLVKNPTSVGLILSSAFSFAGMFAFFTAGSFVYIDIYGVSPNQFAYLYGLNVVALIILTTLNGRLVKILGLHAMLRIGLVLQLLGGIGLLVGWALNWGLWGTVPSVILYIATISVIGSNSMALLLSAYPTMAGTAASLSGTLRFGMGAVVGAVVAALPGMAVWPMVWVMSGCSILSIAFYWTFGRKA
ncbi:Bcr/CflA family multidrug efflux MFS transporter [Vibrio marisflavi]|uniref:Bcr/CflA family efflux transporter n=1 Tax=Vibrio marisflavi CECT 7928 TaxID=634439 RepID=A0ABN8E5J9_9VIBR|nr:Bcr/CflA family multidrug efflux MFS transporter [Vibrio marisflavi]CAH0540256.1 Bicyclomycin resistance protein [Vibrio marisflavi CECT 7928]